MRIGLSVNDTVLEQDGFFHTCRDSGISVLEISLPQRMAEQHDYEKTVRNAGKAGIEVWSVHLPFAPFSEIDPSSLDEKTRRFTVERQGEVIRKAGAAGIRHFIVHASGEPIPVEERRDRLLRAAESLETLAGIAEDTGGVVCVEDLPRTCIGRNSYEILELLKEDLRLRCCFDTNHLLGEYIPDFIRNVGSRIITTHISDYDFWNERHLLPGEGKIDWKELYKTLLLTGYDGPWLYEVGLKAPWCVRRDRDLVCADFVNNAKAIFNGDQPEPVGRMIANMTFWEP